MLPLVRSILIIAGCVIGMTALRAEPLTTQWKFDVLLNDKSIGEHSFTVSRRDNLIQVRSNASMSVKFLFFEAFRYEHQATEHWQDECLISIKSKTNNNNKILEVSGEFRQQGFYVETTANTVKLDDCVRSFAYWDRDLILTANRLLNPQTGKYIDIEVISGDIETLISEGKEWSAERYSLVGEDLYINLWYGPDGRWLRLSSIMENGRELVYELQQPLPPTGIQGPLITL